MGTLRESKPHLIVHLRRRTSVLYLTVLALTCSLRSQETPPAFTGRTRAVVIEIDTAICDGPLDPRLGLARLGYLTPGEVDHLLALRRRSPGATRPAFLGPYDVIDVHIEGGLIQFNGRREHYEPLSVRLRRDETATVSFLRVHKNRVIATEVEVAFHGQALHFDLDRRSGDPRLIKGRIIIAEDRAAWSAGATHQPAATLESKDASASEAQGIRITTRYAHLTPVTERTLSPP